MERDFTEPVDTGIYLDFNSHAHVERDVMPAWYVTQIRISTHTLTWSVTPRDVAHFANLKISTHTLTWSVTANIGIIFINMMHFNSHAHVERDL